MTTDLALQGEFPTQKHTDSHILRRTITTKRRNKKPHGGTMRKHLNFKAISPEDFERAKSPQIYDKELSVGDTQREI